MHNLYRVITRRKLIWCFVGALIAIILTIAICNGVINASAKGKIFSDTADVPYNRVGLLLGTSRRLANGYNNLYYDYRISAAAGLLKSGKIRYLVISGDNGHENYNEPEMMREDLLKAGIDSSVIFLDYAGFRTFDSVKRVKEVFGQDSVTIISQRFHNERALYIASREGISGIGFNARDVNANYGFKTQAREKLARVKVFVDYLFGTEPKFLGPPVKIPRS
ncbi:MAG: vancomycin high temperature exclusion protein [Sphingobacteriales bacterium]|nr:MAG: vancomycin high temperature exclusion protein [Sphingobacteriales bacterium]